MYIIIYIYICIYILCYNFTVSYIYIVFIYACPYRHIRSPAPSWAHVHWFATFSAERIQESLISVQHSIGSFPTSLQGKHKMHELYLHFISCKGVWERCSLVIQASKENQNQRKETFEWWTRDRMIKELGCEELADDLIQRHKTAESHLPISKKGRYIIKNLCSCLKNGSTTLSKEQSNTILDMICYIPSHPSTWEVSVCPGIPTFQSVKISSATRTSPAWRRRRLRPTKLLRLSAWRQRWKKNPSMPRCSPANYYKVMIPAQWSSKHVVQVGWYHYSHIYSIQHGQPRDAVLEDSEFHHPCGGPPPSVPNRKSAAPKPKTELQKLATVTLLHHFTFKNSNRQVPKWSKMNSFIFLKLCDMVIRQTIRHTSGWQKGKLCLQSWQPTLKCALFTYSVCLCDELQSSCPSCPFLFLVLKQVYLVVQHVFHPISNMFRSEKYKQALADDLQAAEAALSSAKQSAAEALAKKIGTDVALQVPCPQKSNLVPLHIAR